MIIPNAISLVTVHHVTEAKICPSIDSELLRALV